MHIKRALDYHFARRADSADTTRESDEVSNGLPALVVSN
jgi:hypothetical protein